MMTGVLEKHFDELRLILENADKLVLDGNRQTL